MLIEPEVEALRDLLDQLEVAIADPEPDDPVTQRLFPAAYPDDEAAEQEYRELTESSLRDERLERLAACRAELTTDSWITMDAETGRRWIQVLNDLRLAIGTRVGITEDDVPPVEHSVKTLYYWLTHLQDDIVQALMRPK